MFNEYPYTDMHQLNLDWLIKKINEAFDAANIKFEPGETGLTSTNVQDAIVEVVNHFISSAVTSFNGRTGAITPQSGDYTASEISIQTIAGLIATNVQTALEEINLKAGVHSFNGRNGDITPSSGDYDADIVNITAISGLVATTVQTALEEINLKAGVPSFNGRTGSITPTSGDYDAEMVDYSNTVSGLTATDVQAAIDEVTTMIFSSGVASFNGRTGVVNPSTSDYDADQIDYDNSNSGLTATNVQDAIDEILAGPGTVQVTLTLYGAKEDNITITDNDGVSVATCIFGTGATSGTVVIDVPIEGSYYKFTSSVALDPADDTSEYKKTVFIDGDSTAVNVMPDGAAIWYGNYSCPLTGTIYGTGDHTITNPTTNEVALVRTGSGLGDFESTNNINLTGYTTYKCRYHVGSNVGVKMGVWVGSYDFRFTENSPTSYTTRVKSISSTESGKLHYSVSGANETITVKYSFLA